METPASSYDVVCVGTQLAPLLTGALLAKRGFRVLLVSQEERPPTYRSTDDVVFPREPFHFVPASSPIARRVLAELAVHPRFRRHAVQIDPAFQVCLPRHRFELAREPELLGREIEREFPEVKRPIEDFLRINEAQQQLFDAVFDHDLAWPPDTFFERRDHARATSILPFGKHGTALDPLAELPERHPFRLVVELPARFSDGMDPDHTNGLRLSRLFGAWRLGAAALEGGYATLRALLVEAIEAHGGVLREGEKIDRVRVGRGGVTGVRLAASGQEIGAGWVVNGAPLRSLLSWVPDRAPFEELFERIGEPVVRYYRYTLNLRVRPEAVPEGMSQEVFFVRDPRRPLVGANALHVEAPPVREDGRRHLTVEALLPRRAVEETSDFASTMRERVVASLSDLMPFLGEHAELIDSPHDGRGAQDLERRMSVTPAEPWHRGVATMRAVYGFPVSTSLGIAALPVRAPVKRLLFASDQVVPGLGLEGLFLAAWSAARVVSRADARRDRLRRGRWGKLEL
ncbi:MAG: hypothetical protein KF729_19935 [Sandaracinaceae bacterium]|nr:hypothetical protein [Sandaracinaceae bacterium]